jgi:hypothetical protein
MRLEDPSFGSGEGGQLSKAPESRVVEAMLALLEKDGRLY